MRIRATAAAVLGALALSALAVPTAQAAGTTAPNVTFSKMKVNAGKAITVGATSTVKVKVTYTVTHPSTVSLSGIATGPLIYRGTSAKSPDNEFISDDPGTCTKVDSTTANCSATIAVTAADLYNSEAGTWKEGGLAVNSSGGMKWQSDLGTIPVRRTAKLTADATPEPVKKGKTLTVTGKLTRADWQKGTYVGFGGQSVKLQFRKAGTSTYTTLKTITSSSTGALKTTVTAGSDGYYRYSFAGTSTTSSVSAAGDYVDVQ
ncbi:hypothetical protein [Streptomyces sp. F-1]|uniref:hypothetical protein n=1 Tax=Streptomyces sp. F-1 TaxID=463642 RepID=UPI00085CD4A1|nr:hypothetical protein [Streptomyces sp. F-1]SFY47097.1 hypothetical protein STEPF1_00303 [Streptomyces sp. F-1]